jgi:hypothetical protein
MPIPDQITIHVTSASSGLMCELLNPDGWVRYRKCVAHRCVPGRTGSSTPTKDTVGGHA